MQITFFSDTHTKHREVELSSGDVLVHCGDITSRGELDVLEDFSRFLSEQDFKHKIVIAGNHDLCFEDERKKEAEECLLSKGIIYLNESGAKIEGFEFWGSPIQPFFHNWAFNKQRGEEIRAHWELIPMSVDVLLTHGPPFGILDDTTKGLLVGCEELLKKVQDIKPKIHAFGHIHEGYGMKAIDGVSYVNACVLDQYYKMKNKPIIIEL